MQIVKSDFKFPNALTNFAVINDNDNVMIAGGVENNQKKNTVFKLNSKFKVIELPSMHYPRSDFTLS